MSPSICSRCVMDVSAKEIVFDAKGICNFCKEAEIALSKIGGVISYLPFKRPYDCLIGLSGGVDSSYTLYEAVRLGYHPLCFSVDTGYNKPEADENIMRLVEKLKVPFYRYIIDIKRFQELQAAFMRAGVKNIEIPTDHILMAASFEMAAKYGITTIFSGGNIATESIMPPSWGYNARDLTHIKAIYKKMTGKRLRGIPLCGLLRWNYYRWVKKIQIVYLLDYFSYNRKVAEMELTKLFGFRSTGEKHEENYFTWWFQNWYLYEKWGIDKRKAHYSSMIMSGQMSRREAIEKLHCSPIYPEFVIQKQVMSFPKHEHEEYPMDKWYGRIAKIVNLCA